MNSDLLHHIFQIFLYLTKTSYFYFTIDQNPDFIKILIKLINKISDLVTLDILTLLRDMIDQSFRIAQTYIYTSKDLIEALMNLIKPEEHNLKNEILEGVILAKILKNRNNDENYEEVNYEAIKDNLREVIRCRLLNDKDINAKLVRVFTIILDIIGES